jgi:hypothetical protein
MDDSAGQPSLRRLVAQTGWAAKQGRRPDGDECHHCNQPLDDCEGCSQRRCLNCEPYLSDDRRWTL